MEILGISGKRGSGKSMLANFLIEKGYRRVSLAGLLKKRCMDEFGLDAEQVNGCLKESPTQYKRTDGHYLTPRDIMIRMGIFYRSIDSLYWCKALLKALEHGDWNYGQLKYVIDDVRFINEVKFFKSMGAKFIRIERDQELNVYKAALDDLSETELDTYKDWDFKLPAELNRIPQDLKTFAAHLTDSLQVK